MLSTVYSNLLLKSRSSLKDDIFEIVTSQVQDRPYVIFSSDLNSVYRSEKMTLLGGQLSKFGNTIRDIFDQPPLIARYLDVFTSSNQAKQKRLPGKLSDSVLIGRKKVIHIELESFYLSSGKRYLMAALKLGTVGEPLLNFQGDFGLTMREAQIAQLAADGMSSTEVGERLTISPWSVKNHLKNIYRKTGVNNRASLAQIVAI